MLSIRLLRVLLSFVTAISAVTLQSVQDMNSSIAAPLPSNSSVSQLNKNGSSNHEISCHPILGSPLNPASCAEVVRQIVSTDKPLVFGNRGTGNFDISLPYRIMSRKWSYLSAHHLPLCTSFVNASASGRNMLP